MRNHFILSDHVKLSFDSKILLLRLPGLMIHVKRRGEFAYFSERYGYNIYTDFYFFRIRVECCLVKHHFGGRRPDWTRKCNNCGHREVEKMVLK